MAYLICSEAIQNNQSSGTYWRDTKIESQSTRVVLRVSDMAAKAPEVTICSTINKRQGGALLEAVGGHLLTKMENITVDTNPRGGGSLEVTKTGPANTVGNLQSEVSGQLGDFDFKPFEAAAKRASPLSETRDKSGIRKL